MTTSELKKTMASFEIAGQWLWPGMSYQTGNKDQQSIQSIW